MTYTLGCDPEFFVAKKERPKTPIPVCGLVGGTKEAPIKVPYADVMGRSRGIEGFAYLEDSVAYEFNTPPASNPDDFRAYVDNMMSWNYAMLSTKGLVPRIKPYARFSHKTLAALSKEADVIGCAPDLIAYNANEGFKRKGTQLVTADLLKDTRVAGGHLHLGYDVTKCPRHIMSQWMDLFIALPTLHADKQNTRREFYGIPGAFREKPYGIEYRTLSNFWIEQGSYAIGTEVFRVMRAVCEHPENAVRVYQSVPWYDVREAIQFEDVKVGGDILRHITNTHDFIAFWDGAYRDSLRQSFAPAKG